MLINFPYTLRPQLWNEVMYQDRAVRTMQSWLRANILPGFIFVTGSTGTGKTVLIKLLVTTTHCLNRPAGVAENCGYCAVCKSDPQLTSGYANVVWVAAESSRDGDGKEITYQRSIVEALHQADRGPVLTGHAHRDILYIVFEEAHLMPKDLFQRCLAKADTTNPYAGDVVLVFLTMAPEEMPDRSRQAISQRGAIVQLDTPTNEQISLLLQHRFQILPEIADLLARVSYGSIRGAYSAYKDCLDYAQPITKESVQLKLRFATDTQRQIIWQAIAAKLSPTEFNRTVAPIFNGTDLTALAELLQDDLDAAYHILGEDLWWTASKMLIQYSCGSRGLSLRYLLLNMRSLIWPLEFYTQNLNVTTEPTPATFVNRLLTEAWTTPFS